MAQKESNWNAWEVFLPFTGCFKGSDLTVYHKLMQNKQIKMCAAFKKMKEKFLQQKDLYITINPLLQ